MYISFSIYPHPPGSSSNFRVARRSFLDAHHHMRLHPCSRSCKSRANHHTIPDYSFTLPRTTHISHALH